MFKKKIFLPLMLILLLTLTGCTTNDDMDVNTGPEEDLVVDEEAAEEPLVEEDEVVEDPLIDEIQTDDYSAIAIKPEEAFDIYMEKYPATSVKEVQLDKDMGKYVYEIEGYDTEKEYEIKIDALDGTILKKDADIEIMDEYSLEEITRTDVEKVAALVDEALLEVGADAILDEWTLDVDDGRTLLEIEIERRGFDDIEYTYDVGTGKVIEIDD